MQLKLLVQCNSIFNRPKEEITQESPFECCCCLQRFGKDENSRVLSGAVKVSVQWRYFLERLGGVYAPKPNTRKG